MDKAPVRILWADDEIEVLKPHIKFLEQKGMEVTGVTNGEDALSEVGSTPYDLIFLDENMPGMNGLETLSQIKETSPNLPVVMITKSEAEDLMEEAIGKQISDYLIKPVNPTQILHSVKKQIKSRELVGHQTNVNYQQDFSNIAMALQDRLSHDEWASIYKKLMRYDRELENSEDSSMRDILREQQSEANVNFGKFVTRNYLDWVNTDPGERPLMSPDLLPQKVFPLLEQDQESTFFLLIDCLRYDQWRSFQELLTAYFRIEEETSYYSILPTATQYARNSIFAGLFPSEIKERFPRYWVDDDEQEGKNKHESDFLQELISRKRMNIRSSYHKLIRGEDSKQLGENIKSLLQNELNVIVVNFIDMVAHARAEMNIIKELAPDESALRSLSRSWLEHSTLFSILKQLAQHNVRIVLTTDHGVIRVRKPVKIIGDRDTTTNLRYKQGRNLNYDTKARQIFSVTKPEAAGLPKSSVSATYAFLSEDYFFVYPNNYNHYVNQYTDTLQHGGISLEEMIVPYAVLRPK